MMGNYPMLAMLPASDIERAKRWYEEKLGVTPTREEPAGLEYLTGGYRFGLFPSAFAGTNQATAAGFEVDDLEKAVDDLSSRGVTFEQYDLEYVKTDERGIASIGDVRGAWFKDSEGNIIAVVEPRPS